MIFAGKVHFVLRRVDLRLTSSALPRVFTLESSSCQQCMSFYNTNFQDWYL